VPADKVLVALDDLADMMERLAKELAPKDFAT
jgi:hypothetical protein